MRKAMLTASSQGGRASSLRRSSLHPHGRPPAWAAGRRSGYARATPSFLRGPRPAARGPDPSTGLWGDCQASCASTVTFLALHTGLAGGEVASGALVAWDPSVLHRNSSA